LKGSITYNVPAFLEHLTGGITHVEVTGSTVGECLEYFVKEFPETKELLFDESGRLLGHIEIFVNGLSAFPEESARPVHDGDTVSMVYLITGG
jgi:molybdopterin converting factor small subunit